MPRRRSQLLIVALVCILASFWASAARAHGVTLKLHHFLPADSPFHTQFLLPWLAKVENESHGLLRFQVFPAQPKGPLYDQVKAGAADIVWTAVGNPAGRFPAFKVFNLPFTIHSAQGSSRALWEYVQANDLANKEFVGVRLHVLPQCPVRSLRAMDRERQIKHLKGREAPSGIADCDPHAPVARNRPVRDAIKRCERETRSSKKTRRIGCVENSDRREIGRAHV